MSKLAKLYLGIFVIVVVLALFAYMIQYTSAPYPDQGCESSGGT